MTDILQITKKCLERLYIWEKLVSGGCKDCGFDTIVRTKNGHDVYKTIKLISCQRCDWKNYEEVNE